MTGFFLFWFILLILMIHFGQFDYVKKTRLGLFTIAFFLKTIENNRSLLIIIGFKQYTFVQILNNGNKIEQ